MSDEAPVLLEVRRNGGDNGWTWPFAIFDPEEDRVIALFKDKHEAEVACAGLNWSRALVEAQR